MSDFIQTMFWPLVACLLLAGIHVYLGIHVLARQVIFVDLALAQIAAFGSVLGIVLGAPSKLLALGFALLGAAFFTLMQTEAFIGISYAVALSATILVSSHLPHGADELRELLSGNILWVEPESLAYAAGLYTLIGIFHWIFRDKFFASSFKMGSVSKWWDFAFYASFAFVVTSSVSIAGVLLVFCYLVIPAVAAMALVQGVKSRLILGWAIGAFVSCMGVTASYYFDLPSGPAIVICFAVFLGLALGVSACRSKQMS